jgi:translation initiation factor 1
VFFTLFSSKKAAHDSLIRKHLYVRINLQSSAQSYSNELGVTDLVSDEGGICPNCGLPTDLCVCETIAQEEARITVTIERRKWGRLTTVVSGFDKTIDIGEMATKLKSKLACGGAAKHGHVELQGDHRGTITQVLGKLGFPEEMVVVDWTFQRRGRR